MMNLALMNRFFLAVDKDGRSPISDALLSRWDVEGLATHCRSSENFAWRVGERGEETYFLRFNHATERNVEAIDGELAFVEHLASLGLPVARPIASSAGLLVETIETELGVFHGSLLTALHGDEPDAEQLDLPSLEVWGRLVARVHTASQGFTTAGRKTWKEALQAVQQITPRSHAIVHQEIRAVEHMLSKYPQEELTFGLIHNDIDNCVWRYGDIDGIMDFDDSIYCWFEADIVSALCRLFNKRIDLNDPRLLAFLEGYRDVRPMHDSAIARFPIFMRFHSLLGYARILWSLGDGPEEKELDWAAALRQNCHQWLASDREEYERSPLTV